MNLLIGNFIFCLLVAVVVNLSNLPKKHKRNIFIFVSFISLFIFHTFVDIRTVPDLQSYEDSYRIIANTSIDKVTDVSVAKMEDGFKYYMKICSLVSSNFYFFLSVNSFVLLFLYYKVFDKFSFNIYISILLLILTTFNQSIYVLRQHLAMAIVLFSISSILNRELIKFLLIVFIAFLLHQTAIIFLPVYFLYGVKKPSVLTICLVGVLILSYMFFGIFATFLVGNYLSGYDSYLDSDKLANITGFIISLLILLMYVFFLRKKVYDDGINRFLFICLSLASLLTFIGLGTFSFTSRLSMYFTVTLCLVIPVILKNISFKLLQILCLLFVFLLKFYQAYYSNSSANNSTYDLIGL